MPGNAPAIWTQPQQGWTDPGTPASTDFMQARDQDLAFLFQQLGSTGRKMDVFVSPGAATWTATFTGTIIAYLIAGGGGGGGGSNAGNGGGGGGGGAFQIIQLSVVQGVVYNLNVGAAGTAGLGGVGGGSDGGVGGDSWFGVSTQKAAGGVQGLGAANGSTGGAGGLGVLAANNFGISGQPGVASVSSTGGNGGQSPAWYFNALKVNAPGAASGAPGVDGNDYGCGGGGGGRHSPSNNAGAGKGGAILIFS